MVRPFEFVFAQRELVELALRRLVERGDLAEKLPANHAPIQCNWVVDQLRNSIILTIKSEGAPVDNRPGLAPEQKEKADD